MSAAVIASCAKMGTDREAAAKQRAEMLDAMTAEDRDSFLAAEDASELKLRAMFEREVKDALGDPAQPRYRTRWWQFWRHKNNEVK